MVGSNEDIQEMFKAIRKILDDLQANRSKSLTKKADPETIAKYVRLEQLLTLFQDFNDAVIKQQGITEDEIKRGLNPKYQKEGKLDPLVEEADKLRCEVLINEAAFIREQFKEALTANRPFGQTTKGIRERQSGAQKKALKKKYKKMREDTKWKKI